MITYEWKHVMRITIRHRQIDSFSACMKKVDGASNISTTQKKIAGKIMYKCRYT